MANEVKTTAVARMDAYQLADYLHEQMAIFKTKGQNPMRALTHEIYPTGKFLPNGVEIYNIRKRPYSLEVRYDNDGREAVFTRASNEFIETMGGNERAMSEDELILARTNDPYFGNIDGNHNDSDDNDLDSFDL